MSSFWDSSSMLMTWLYLWLVYFFNFRAFETPIESQFGKSSDHAEPLESPIIKKEVEKLKCRKYRHYVSIDENSRTWWGKLLHILIKVVILIVIKLSPHKQSNSRGLAVISWPHQRSSSTGIFFIDIIFHQIVGPKFALKNKYGISFKKKFYPPVIKNCCNYSKKQLLIFETEG